MTNALFKCLTCENIFRSRAKLKDHVKHDHQSSINIKFQDGDVVQIKRGEDNAFKCKCGKGFKLPVSLQRHGKNCKGELIAREEEERGAELMDASDLDASENMNMNDRVMPIDCIGTRISLEKADYR